MAIVNDDDTGNPVNGTADDDTLNGFGGNDTISGFPGNDQVRGGTGDDSILGGDGDDTAIFNVSTDGADTTDLGDGADLVNVVRDSAGQVRLTFTSSEVGNGNPNDANALANQDGGLAVRMQAEDGSDGLTGPVSRFDDEGIGFSAAAPDVTFDVRDLVSGTARGDQFTAVVLGTDQSDTLPALFPDLVYYFNAGMGDDSVLGGNSNDFLVGGGGMDTLVGGTGNNSFIGGGGNDSILGGADNDTAIVNVSTDGADAIDLGEGADLVNVAQAAAAQIQLTFTSSEVGNGNANDANTMTNQDGGLAIRMQAEDGADALTGPITRLDDEGSTFVATTAGVTFDVRDLVSGTARGDQFQVVGLGTSAADTLTAMQPDRPYYFNAGIGDDMVTGGNGNDFLVGGGGIDTLVGGTGNNSFIGGGGNDSILGGADNDTAIVNVSSDGADMIDLGEGADLVNVAQAAAGQIRLTFTSSEVGNGNANDANTMTNQDGGLAVRMQAEDGADALTGPITRLDDEGITFVATTAGVSFDVRDLVAGTARGDQFQVVALGTSTADSLKALQADRPYYLNAGQGDDTVSGGNGNDFLVGGAGLDVLIGGAGDNSFIGGGGDDTMFGGAGNESMAGGLGDDRIYGDEFASGAGNNSIAGGDGNDTLYGGGGDNTVLGEAGDDALVGDDGADSLMGGIGNDIAVGGEGNDTILGEAGMDSLFGGNGDDSILGGSGVDWLYGEAGNDTLSGGAGTDSVQTPGNELPDDRLYGGDGNDVITAGAGNDILVGGIGADSMDGGTGEDLLFGQAGADTLSGGIDAFYDRFRGGADADTFVMKNLGGSASSIYDVIQDFADAEGDLIDVRQTGATSVASFTEMNDIGGGVMLGTADLTRFLIVGQTSADVVANPDWFIFA